MTREFLIESITRMMDRLPDDKLRFLYLMIVRWL